MPLNTRSKKRELINAFAEFSIDNSAEQAIKLNISKESLKVGSNESVKSELLDISVSGCGIISPYIIPPGVILNIKIDPKYFNIEGKAGRKDDLVFTGVVKFCIMQGADRYRIGIHFQKPKKEDTEFISGFISANDRRKDQRWPMNER